MSTTEMQRFVDINGLDAFLIELWKIFASKIEYNTLMNLVQITDPYILEIDYDKDLAFDTTEIVT